MIYFFAESIWLILMNSLIIHLLKFPLSTVYTDSTKFKINLIVELSNMVIQVEPT